MADITVTPANVAPVSGSSVTGQGLAGEAILAGQSIALSSVDGKYYKADNNGAATIQRVDGIALNSAPGVGQPIIFVTKGPYVAGGTVVVGAFYAISPTPGGICPVADLVTGAKACGVGIGISVTQIDVLLHNSGATLP